MKTDCLSLAVGDQIVAEEIQKTGQTQLAVDDGIAALFRIVGEAFSYRNPL